MSFQPFSREHAVAVAAGFLIVAGLLVLGRRGGRARQVAVAVLGFANLSAYPFNLIGWLSLDRPVDLDNLLPFHLCDLAALTAGFALLTGSATLRGLTYFWGLAGTVQALLTPALGEGFPSWPYFTFFIQHFAIVGAALYFPLVEGWRPRRPLWRAVAGAYGWSLAYLLLALTVNALLGTNFGFASRPPDNPSLLDHLGPWPWYLLSVQAIGLAVFWLLVLPFAGGGRR